MTVIEHDFHDDTITAFAVYDAGDRSTGDPGGWMETGLSFRMGDFPSSFVVHYVIPEGRGPMDEKDWESARIEYTEVHAPTGERKHVLPYDVDEGAQATLAQIPGAAAVVREFWQRVERDERAADDELAMYAEIEAHIAEGVGE